MQNITVSDITGKICLEKTTLNDNETIDISELKNGVYIISIKTDNDVFTTKIIKE